MLEKKFDTILDNLFARAASEEVALAVSGGSDSIALLYLTSRWAKNNNIKLSIFTVNHKLRSESDQEIVFVKDNANKLGHNFYEFIWDNQGKKSSLQERAREARYNLMTQKCHELGINTLLTAHHKDDVIETYLMKKSKKSGTLGLSYCSSFFFNNIQIIRPLNHFFKEELINYLLQRSMNWVEDSSNLLDLYERNRVRKLIQKLDPEEKDKLISEIDEVNKKAMTLNQQLLRIIAESVKINNYGFAIIDEAMVSLEPTDIKIQLLNYILTIIGGKTTLPRFRSINKILHLFQNKQKINHSLHGCILLSKKNKLLIYREKSQINYNFIKIGNNDILWDSRFAIEGIADTSDYKIETFSTQDYAQLKEQKELQKALEFVNNNNKSILFTIPVVKNLEKIVAIPHISYYDKSRFNNSLKVIFRPNFVSRFTHFL